MRNIIRVATRGSTLALTQTGQVIDQLKAANPEFSFEVMTIKTTGDRVTDRPLSTFRGTGVFVKELQHALLADQADLAVHSLKDMPVEHHEKLVVVATPERGSPYDLFITADGSTFDTIRSGALVGTSSPRRMLQLKNARADLRFADLRGNVDTRLRKLQDNDYDAIVVAAAGLIRLGKTVEQKTVLPSSICLPAVGQGILALECRSEDLLVREITARINSPQTMYAALCEREFLYEVGGGCAMPIAAYARLDGGSIRIEGLIGDPHTGKSIRMEYQAPQSEISGAGRILAVRMIESCGREGICLS